MTVSLKKSANFVSNSKESMYLTSMSHEELHAEVRKDLIEISTKAIMFMDRVRKKAKSLEPFPIATQRMNITTKRRNVWTLIGRYNAYMQALSFQAYAPIMGNSGNGYIQMSGFKPSDMVMHYTAHFMQRYKERYIDHYRIDLKGESLLEYFMNNNPHVLYTRKNNGGYFIISDHGIAAAEFSTEQQRLLTHITFLGDDELSLKKKLIYDEEIRIYKGVLELVRLKSKNQKDDIITIWNIAKKHNAGFEMVKRWYKWNNIDIPDDLLHQYIDCIEKYHIQTLEMFKKFVSHNEGM